MTLQQIIDKKDTFSLIKSILYSFNPGRIFVLGSITSRC